MNAAAVIATPQARTAWATATMTVMLMSMAWYLGQARRRRSIVPLAPADAAADCGVGGPVQSRRSQADIALRRLSQVPQRPTSPRRRNQRKSAAKQLPTDPTFRRDSATAVEKTPGLHVGHGLWTVLSVPYVSEMLCFAIGIVAIAATRWGHTAVAAVLLVATFFFRMRVLDATTGVVPMLSDASKLHLLKSLDRETLHELLQEDLPRWVKFPDVEKCDWLNNTLETLWPYVKIAVARSVKDALTPVLETLKPKLMMTELGFRGLDLGTAAPVINGIKSQQHLEEQVVIDIDVLIATQNTDVVFTFGNPAARLHMNIELSDFLLRGTLRVVMKPLFPRWPTFGAISISFTEKPTIDFHLKTMHLNLMELPALSSIFHNAIRSAVENACVWPNKILIPLVEDLSRLEMEALAANKPLGMLVIQNLRCSGVNPLTRTSRWTGAHSFHMNLAVGKERVRTDVVRGKTAHDFSGQSFHLLVLDPKTQDLSITLHYKEALSTTRMIDSKWIHLDHLERHIGTSEVISFGRDGVGRAEFELVWYPFSSLTKAQRKKSREAPLPPEIAAMGAVFIKLVKCERLPPMDFNGSSDPYVLFRVGGATKKSSIKGHTLNPIWDPPEHFELIVSNDRHDVLVVTIMDYDYLKADDQIGVLTIPLAQVQRSARLTNTWSLENGSGSVTLELEWRGF